MAPELRQFDVFANPDIESVGIVPYLMILQHDLVDMVPTVLVAPLVRGEALRAVAGLHLPVEVDGRSHVLVLSDLFPIFRRALPSAAVATLSHRRDEIIRALDRLFIGF